VRDNRTPSGTLETFTRNVVIAYDLSDLTPKELGRNDDPGKNGQRLVVAPDGRHLSYVAAGGAPGYGYSIAALSTDDLSRETIRYQIQAYPRDITYHPSANLVACANDNRIWIFNRRTGQRLDDRAGGTEGLQEIRRLLFTPDGSRLLVAHRDRDRGHVVQAIPVQLIDNERADNPPVPP
jgi:hypothetical protein